MNTWDTSRVTSMNKFFIGCSSLTEIDLSSFNTSNVTDMSSMFNCQSGSKLKTIKGIENLNTSKVTNMNYMFRGQNSLQSLDLSRWDVSKATDLSFFVDGVNNLASFYAPQNINVSISDFTSATKLTSEHLMSIINNLNIVTSSQTLKIGSANLVKLTDEQIAIATNKGWTLT